MSRGRISSSHNRRLDQLCLAAVLAITSAVIAGVGGAATPASADPNSDQLKTTQCPGALPQDVPPLGVPIDTITSDLAVKINDEDYLPGGGGARLVFLDRCTLTVSESFAYDRSPGNFDEIAHRIDHWGPNTLVILTYPIAGPELSNDKDLSFFNEQILAKIGAPPVTREQTLFGFSVIGGPKWQLGSAFTNFDRTFDRTSANGALMGYLRVNSLTDRFDFVFSDYVPFSSNYVLSSTQTSSPTQNTMQVGTALYTDTLPQGAASGFQVVQLDSGSLAPLKHQAFATDDAGGQQELASALGEAASDPKRVVVIQSIGNPGRARTQAWADAGNQIAKFGGTSAIFNAVDGARGYALVGRAGMTTLPGEVSQPGDQSSKVEGYLARANSSDFEPMVANASGTNAALLSIVNQEPQPFPAFTDPRDEAKTAAYQRAATFVGKDIMGVCADVADTCDVRAKYSKDYSTANWANRYTDLANTTGRSCKDGDGFTAAQCDDVRAQLAREVRDVGDVKHYIDLLQKPFGDAKTDALVDLPQIAKRINEQLSVSADHRATQQSIQVLSLIAKIGSAAPPPASWVASGLGAAMSLAAYFQPADNTANLVGVISQRAGDLVSDIGKRYRAASALLDSLGKIVVSDYGKLSAMASMVRSDPKWRLPDSMAKVVETMSAGARQSFWQTLLPLAYFVVQVAPPSPDGPATANDYHCKHTPPPEVPDRVDKYPLRDEPASAQGRRVVGFAGDGRPLEQVFALVRTVDNADFGLPSSSLTDPLLRPIDDGGAGFTAEQLYSPRNFDFSRTLTNHAKCPFG